MAYINPKYPAIQVTQAEYDAITYHDPHTLYCIPEAEPAAVIIAGTPVAIARGAMAPVALVGYATAAPVDVVEGV